MKSLLMIWALILLSLNTPIGIYGQNCSGYFGKGYCVDYIQQRLGTRPRGNAADWKPNVAINEMRVGDVAIVARTQSLPFGHVAIIERVIYRENTATPIEVQVSEMNWGRLSTNPQERACAVTVNFNKVTRGRTIKVTALKGVWRPR